MLPEDDCHFDLRKQVHAELQKNNVAVETLVNVSLAWDWSYLGQSAEGINREMTSTLEFALRNRNLHKPKQSLAIPKLCLISSCETSIAALGTRGSTFGMATENNDSSEQRHRNILKGLLPTLEFVVAQEEEACRKAQTSGTATAKHKTWPHSWENPVFFPLDPYGNSDYSCKICLQELANTYMHCDGCEELLKKDFNVCIECYFDSKHCKFFDMNKDKSMDSALNHTGAFSRKKRINCNCEGRVACVNCENCRKCSCTCHHSFTLQQRMWNCDKLFKMRAQAKKIVGDDNIEHFDEVQPRLQEARLAKEVVDSKMPADGTPNWKRRKTNSVASSPADKNLQLMFQTYTYAERESEPTGHLDVVPGALAFTALLPRLELPFLSGTIFTSSMDAHELQEFVTKAIDSPDTDAVLALIGKGTARTNALQLFRNFCDCDKLEYSLRPKKATLVRFSPRERDIIAYAVLLAREGMPCPAYPDKVLTAAWGTVAWQLMPYRPRQCVVDKFSVRSGTRNYVDILEKVLASEDYLKHLRSKVAILFKSVLKTLTKKSSSG